MLDLYIKASNRAAVMDALSEFDNGEGGLIQSHVVVFDTDGKSINGIPITLIPAVMDGETMTTPPVMSPDFHMNARINDDSHQNPEHTMTSERALELKAQLEGTLGSMVRPTPATPQRRWA